MLAGEDVERTYYAFPLIMHIWEGLDASHGRHELHEVIAEQAGVALCCKSTAVPVDRADNSSRSTSKFPQARALLWRQRR